MVNCLKFLDQEPIDMNLQLQKMENIFYQQLVNQKIQYLIQNHLKDFKIKQKVNYEKIKELIAPGIGTYNVSVEVKKQKGSYIVS
tara:strand:+ start:180 stop:434 length:255 start_codon:yes stop_codon:yes gene_type:complete